MEEAIFAVIISVPWTAMPPENLRAGAVSVGNFDGVHAGHRTLIHELGRQAKTLGGPAVVVTFDPHPLKLLKPSDFLPVLTPVADRVALIQHCGAGHVWLVHATMDLLQLSANEFFDEVLCKRLGARA